MKIGFFDSGIGGISVLSHAVCLNPNADYLYYADSEHVPYGTKTRNEIITYSDTAVSFLVNNGADIIVIACNTATSMAVEYLRGKYDIPIIGMEPAVKPAVEAHGKERILVCATPATISGERLHTLIEHNCLNGNTPDLVALPGLVELAENAVFDTDTVCEYLKTMIDKSNNYSAVVLGCTHFGYFRDSFRRFFGNIDIIDGTHGTVNRMLSVINELKIPCKAERGSVSYYSSGTPVSDSKTLDYYRFLLERAKIYYKFH